MKIIFHKSYFQKEQNNKLTENENIPETNPFKTNQNSNLLCQSKLRHFKKMIQGMKGQHKNEKIHKLGVRTTKISGNKRINHFRNED